MAGERRTLRSNRDRALLWYAADGKCQICGQPLGDDWEADHIVPWSVTHRTNVHEMQALCAQCNRKKGANVGYRKHQIEGDRIAREIKGRTKRPKIVLFSVTPGGGKSLLPQIFAHQLIPSVADRICWIVPRDSLREQGEANFIDPKYRKITGHYLEIRAAGNDYDPSRGTVGYITTYQAVGQAPHLHADEFKRYRYILILDELHHVKEGDTWHKALQPLFDRAALVIVMTGTLERGDRKAIAFIPYRDITNADGRPTGSLTPDLTRTDNLEVVQYTRRDALAEQAIIPLEFYHLDGEAQWIDRAGQGRMALSLAMAGKDTRDAIYTALNTGYAYQLLDTCTDKWRAYRVTRPRSKMLVVAHSIQAAKAYVKHLAQRGIDRVAIATSDESEAAQEAINRFKSLHKPDSIDVLVTVAMAYEGLDVPQITHIASLTHIRSRAWIDQMINRGSRVDYEAGPYSSQRGYIFCPDDPLMQEIVKAIREDQEAVARPDDTTWPPPPPPSSGERDAVVPLHGEVTRFRASDLQDGYSLGYEDAAIWEAAMQKHGLQGAGVLQVYAAARDVEAGAITPPQGGSSPTTVTRSKQEIALRKSIEKHIRQYEAEVDVTRGTVNTEMRNKYGKSRGNMNLDELKVVWTYVKSKYPVGRGK